MTRGLEETEGQELRAEDKEPDDRAGDQEPGKPNRRVVNESLNSSIETKYKNRKLENLKRELYYFTDKKGIRKNATQKIGKYGYGCIL